MLRFTVCIALVGLVAGTGYMPSMSYSSSSSDMSNGWKSGDWKSGDWKSGGWRSGGWRSSGYNSGKYMSGLGGSWTGSYSYPAISSYSQPMYSSLYGGLNSYAAQPIAFQAIASQPVAIQTVAAAPIAAAPIAAAPIATATIAAAKTYEQQGPVVAAVQSRHKVSMYDVPSTYSASPALNIEVPSSAPTMNFLMKSRSSDINVESLHESTGGSFKETSSQDEPHVNRHTVTRPVIQEVREIVSPYRKVTQEIQPVQEEVETILPRGQIQEQRIAYTQPIASQQVAIAAAPVAQIAAAAPVAQIAAAPVATTAYVAQPVATAVAVPAVQTAFVAESAPAIISDIKSYGFGYDYSGSGYMPMSGKSSSSSISSSYKEMKPMTTGSLGQYSTSSYSKSY